MSQQYIKELFSEFMSLISAKQKGFLMLAALQMAQL